MVVPTDAPEVVCKLEQLSYVETKIIVAGNVLAMVLGLAGIGGLAVAKAQDTVVLVSSNILPIVNVSVLACTIMAMIVAATASIWRLHAIGKHKKWDRLRRYMVYTNLVMILAIIIIHVLLIAENALVLVLNCWWLHPPAQAMAILQFFVGTCTNVIFCTLLLQVHLLCPQSQLGMLVHRRLRMMMLWIVRRCTRPVPAVQETLQQDTLAMSNMELGVQVSAAQISTSAGDMNTSMTPTPYSSTSLPHEGSTNHSKSPNLPHEGSMNNHLPSQHNNGMKGASDDSSSMLPSAHPFIIPSDQLPSTSVGAMPGWRHWHISVLFVVVESMSIALLVLAIQSASDPTLIGMPMWNSSTDLAIDAFSGYFGEPTRPTWQSMATAAQPPQPWSSNLSTGLEVPNASVQLFGPNNTLAPGARNVFQLYTLPQLPLASLPLLNGFTTETVQANNVSDSLFSFISSNAWMVSLFTPWGQLCSTMPRLNIQTALEAVTNNTLAFRQQFDLPSCSQAPKNDATCTAFRCPVDFGTYNIKLSNYLVYLVLWILYVIHVLRALHHMNTYSYTRYRLANTWLRLQMREGLVVLFGVVISLILLTLVGGDRCTGHIIDVLGAVPIMVMWSVLLACRSYYVMPTLSDPKHTVLMERQMFAWAASEVGDMVKEQDHGQEPEFCYETALKLMFWSILAYRETKKSGAPEPVFNLEHGKSMDGLVEHEIVIVPQHDFAAVLAWGPGKMFVTFRGTASFKNVFVDLNALQRRHPHVTVEQTSCCVCRNPNVHKGFWASWESGRDRVLTTVRTVLTNPQYMDETSVFTLSMTGHSLGGALATLAAWDVRILAAELGIQERLSIQVYTYGSPQTGNHTFAQQFKAVIPAVWDIVNDDDIVPRSTKYMRVYQRTGHRVIISKSGDLLCRPSWMEMNVKNTSLNSMEDHHTRSYRAAFAAIAVAQFNVRKGVCGGPEGVRRLWQNPDSRQLMEWVLGTTLDEFRGFARREGEAVSSESQAPTSLGSALLQSSRMAWAMVVELFSPVRRVGAHLALQTAPDGFLDSGEDKG